MRIALINENSQVNKNEVIYKFLKEICDKKGYELYNLGMTNTEDPSLTYVQNGLLAAILLPVPFSCISPFPPAKIFPFIKK